MNPQKVFISYSHGNETFMNNVVEISNKLRTYGLDCEVDQYEFMPSEGWYNWCARKIDEADFVLVLSTERYFNSFQNNTHQDKGKGVIFEGIIITEDIYNNGAKNDKFIPILFNPDDQKYIPKILRSASRYNVSQDDSFMSLYRHLTNQPSVKKAPIGNIIHLYTKEVKTDFTNFSNKSNIDKKLKRYDGLRFEHQNTNGFDEYTNIKDGSTMIRIPVGTFLRGISVTEDGAPDWRPQKLITLKEFFIDKFPITNKQYEEFINESETKISREKEGVIYDKENKCWRKETHKTWERYYQYETKDHPVVFITWEEAKEYAKWAGKRLPYEAEWEMAAKGPIKEKTELEHIYPWGRTVPDKSFANYNNNIGQTTSVGEYEKGSSFYGCLEMAGNVWEWCEDFYDIVYYEISSTKNPTGPLKGTRRINRGGSWIDNEEALKCSFRVGDDSLRYSHVGFRCALSFDDE